MFLWIAFGSAILIPKDLPVHGINTLNSKEEIQKRVNNSQLTVIFFGDSTDSQNQERIKLYNNAVCAFPKYIDTCYYAESANYQDFLQKFQQNGPSLVFFRRNSPWLILPFTMDETSLMFSLDHFLTMKVIAIESIEHMASHLGHHNFAFVAPREHIHEAMSARLKVTPYIGMVDIFACESEFAEVVFGTTGKEIGIYRTEDSAIDSVNMTRDSIFEKIVPRFRKFLMSDFTQENATFATLISDDVSEKNEQVLYEMATIHSDLTVGWVPPHLHHVVENIVLHEIEKPAFLMFTYNPKSYWEFPFDKISGRTVSEYIEACKNGTIARKFHSDEKPTEQTGIVEKLVGTTYADFINDEAHDLMVLYYERENEETRIAMDAMEQAAKFINDKSIRFAMINSKTNSADVKFPVMHKTPYIRFYPVINRTENSLPFAHQNTRDDIVRFLKRQATTKIEVEVPQKKKSELKYEVSEYSRLIAGFSESDSGRVGHYLHKLWMEIPPEEEKNDDDDEL